MGRLRGFWCTFSSIFWTFSATFSSLSEIKDEADDLTESHSSAKLFGIVGKDGSSSGGSSFFAKN